jgi:AraC-like DNA-binding protein
MEIAIKFAQKGASLTQCAHIAGFVDSSHFTKTFKNVFGIYP